MDDIEHAVAYAEADFSTAHQFLVDQLALLLPALPADARALDLGCGPADVTVRFALAYPGWHIDGVDGAPAMLGLGRDRIAAAGLVHRVRLHLADLPRDPLPGADYQVLLSNSLLHHLHEPRVLWRTLCAAAAPGAAVYVSDLRRPQDEVTLQALLVAHGTAGSAVLRHDFEASLRAAFRADEVRNQLAAAGLAHLSVVELTDRHLAVFGYLS